MCAPCVTWPWNYTSVFAGCMFLIQRSFANSRMCWSFLLWMLSVRSVPHVTLKFRVHCTLPCSSVSLEVREWIMTYSPQKWRMCRFSIGDPRCVSGDLWLGDTMPACYSEGSWWWGWSSSHPDVECGLGLAARLLLLLRRHESGPHGTTVTHSAPGGFAHRQLLYIQPFR